MDSSRSFDVNKKIIELGQYSEIQFNGINGRILATMTEDDVRGPPFSMSKFCDVRV